MSRVALSRTWRGAVNAQLARRGNREFCESRTLVCKLDHGDERKPAQGGVAVFHSRSDAVRPVWDTIAETDRQRARYLSSWS